MTNDQRPADDANQDHELSEAETALLKAYISLTLAIGRISLQETIYPTPAIGPKPRAMRNLALALSKELARREARKRLITAIALLIELDMYRIYLDHMLIELDSRR